MRIALDAIGISRRGGGRMYMLPLLKSLATQYSDIEFDVWLDGPETALSGFGNLTQHFLAVKNRFLVRILLQMTLPILTARRRSVVTHFMKNLTLVGAGGRTVVTVYDLHPVVQPRIYPTYDVLYWKYVQPAALRRVDRIIAISQHTAQDLIRRYRLDPHGIDIIYPGVDTGFRPRSDQEVAGTLVRYGVGPRYVIHVGAVSPKKNLEALIRAFAITKADGYPGDLVLVGAVYEKLDAVPLAEIARRAGVGESLRILGEVPDDHLRELVAGAEVFVFPSMYEGFGLAVAEAMASGVPVVVARAGAVAEVVGDAAPVVEDGANHIELAQRIGEIIRDSSRRDAVARACLRRAALFSWEAAASSTMSVYEKTIQSHRRLA